MNKPAFDPNKPFKATAKPAFDPKQPFESGGPSILDAMSNAADKISSTMPAAASFISPTLGMAQYAGQKINEASGRLGGELTEFAGEKGVPGPSAAVIGAVGSIAANPMSYTTPEINPSFKLQQASGKPGVAARLKQMRTGVDASAFEQLRRDPGAFFSLKSRKDAGQAIGEAKQAAGISTGVTGDIKTLTPENLSRARSIQGTANKAQDTILEKIKNGSPIEANEVSIALDGINKRLAKLEKSEGRGSPSFQQWSQIKSHFQNMLEDVAPDVKAANKDFSRVALRDKFMEPVPVNQSGTMSKINTFGFTPVSAAAGGIMAGAPGAIAGAAIAQAARSPFIAGLGTATRGLIDKVVDPGLSKVAGVTMKRGSSIEMINSNNRDAYLEEYISRMMRKKNGQ